MCGVAGSKAKGGGQEGEGLTLETASAVAGGKSKPCARIPVAARTAELPGRRAGSGR